MYMVPLSIMISLTAPHLYKISLKINMPRVWLVSVQRVCHLGHAVSKHHAYMMYRKPKARGMNIVLM